MIKSLLAFTLASSSLLMVSCALMERSPESGYSSKSAPRTVRKSSQTVSEMSVGKTELNLSDKTRLKQLENSISTKKELEQYSKSLPYFESEQERIEFLTLGDFEERQRWLKQNNFPSRASQITSRMNELVEAQDIAIGMPQSLVKKSWGDPEAIEVSGNPLFKNERWKYNKYISTNDGYKLEKKIVYFEGGKVVGWEVE